MPKSDRPLILVLCFSLLALAVAVADSLRDRVVRVGDTAPDFSVRADNGLTVSPKSFGGKVLVLNFWATWCPPCVEETPSLVAFAEAYREKGVVVLGVSVDKSQKNYENFIRRFRIGFLTSRDAEAKISDEYGTYIYPETYVIDRSGKVVQKIVGKTDWTDANMTRFIDSLL